MKMASRRLTLETQGIVYSTSDIWKPDVFNGHSTPAVGFYCFFVLHIIFMKFIMTLNNHLI